MIDARREIIFRDVGSKEIFRIKDGDSIKITRPVLDGEEVYRKCRYTSKTHFYVGDKHFHVNEFAKVMAQFGNTYEPIPDQAPKLDTVLVLPDKTPRYMRIPVSLEALQNIVGGELEITKQNDRVAFVRGKDGNGTLIVCGLDGENLTSLHPHAAQNYKFKLEERPTASPVEKPPIAERLEAGKQRAAEHNASRSSHETPRKVAETTEH